MFAPKGLCCVFGFVGETVRSFQEVSHSKSDWAKSLGHCKVWSHIMKKGHAGQNFKLVSSHPLIFVSKRGQHLLLPQSQPPKSEPLLHLFSCYQMMSCQLTTLMILLLPLSSLWQTCSLCVGPGSLQAFPPLLSQLLSICRITTVRRLRNESLMDFKGLRQPHRGTVQGTVPDTRPITYF